MKIKAFFGGLSLLLVLNLLVKPAWIFLIDRQVQNIIGQESYGQYFALFNLTYVLLFFADAGLTNLLTQSLAAGRVLNFRQLAATKLLLLFLYATVCFFVAWLTGIQQWLLLFYLVLFQSLASLSLFLRGVLTAAQLFKVDALFSVLDKTLMLLFCIGPLYGFFFRINLYRFLQLQIVATSVTLLLLLVTGFRKRLFVPAASQQTVFDLLKSSVPFLLIVLLMAMHYRLDGFLLERLHPNGATQAGIYASAYRLLDAGNTAGYLCVSFLVPFVARNRNEKLLVENTTLALRHGLLFIAVLVVAFVFAFAPWLQALLYHSADTFNSGVIALCIAVLPAYYLVHVYGSLLTAITAFRPFIHSLVLSVIINVVLNLLFIPSLGALGCCLAALVSQYACAFLLFFAASQKLSLRYGFGWFGVYAVFGIACWLAFSSLKNSGTAVWTILVAACFAAVIILLTQKTRLKQFIAVLNS